MLSILWIVALAGRPVDLPDADIDGEIDPGDVPAVSEGLDLLLAGRTHDAAERFASAAVKRPDADVRYLEAHARYLAGELRAAERVAAEGLAATANHGPLLALQGLVLADLDAERPSAAELEQAISVAIEGFFTAP